MLNRLPSLITSTWLLVAVNGQLDHRHRRARMAIRRARASVDTVLEVGEEVSASDFLLLFLLLSAHEISVYYSLTAIGTAPFSSSRCPSRLFPWAMMTTFSQKSEKPEKQEAKVPALPRQT